MKKVVVLQSNYLPWKGYFDLIHEADLFVFYDEVQYTKNDWRNRNRIYPEKGLQWITAPVARDAHRKKISEVKFKNDKWKHDHFATIRSAYGRAKHFHQLEKLLSEIYFEREWEYLSEFNQYSIKKIAARIGIRTPFENSKDFKLEGDKAPKLTGLLNQVRATEYLTGPSARSYLSGSEYLFLKNDIKLIYKAYPEYRAYTQLAKPFVHEVSIVDLIAHVKFDDIKNYIWSLGRPNDKD